MKKNIKNEKEPVSLGVSDCRRVFDPMPKILLILLILRLILHVVVFVFFLSLFEQAFISLNSILFLEI